MPTRLRFLNLCLLCTVLLSATACRIADLRDDTSMEGVASIDEASRARGASLLAKMLKSHGGSEAYRAADTARVVVSDTWPSWLERTFVMPWGESGQRMELQLDLGTENSRMTVLDGPDKGQVVGIQNWTTYHLDQDARVVFKGDEETWFWLPTLHYFTEAAFRIGEAQYMGYAGRKTHAGKTYEGVFLTWGSVEPSMEVDQYVAWIDPDTHRLGMLEYTVRDFYRFVTGTAVYSDYSAHDGVLLPGTITIYSGDVSDQGVLHVMKVHEVEVGGVSKDILIPDPSRVLRKQDKGEP